MSRYVEIRFNCDVPIPGRDGIGVLVGHTWRPTTPVDIKRKGNSLIFATKRQVTLDGRQRSVPCMVEVPMTSVAYIVTTEEPVSGPEAD